MKIGLIIIGDEILSGKRADKHLPQVIELLAARGLELAWARYVGDDPARITADLKDAFASRDLVFSCGGIGATPDDHTRQCAAAALGVPLVLHPEARDFVIERMKDVAREQGTTFDPDRDDNRHRLNMAMFPAGAEIIPNPYNKIAGFSVRSGDGGVFFVPGFPVMAWPMIEWVLDHRFAHLHVGQGNARAFGDRVRRDGGGADAADGGDRVGPSRHQGVQPAERRPSRVGPAHRARRQGRSGFARRRLPRAARRPRKRNRPSLVPSWCDSVAIAPYRCERMHHTRMPTPGRSLARFLLNSVRDFGAPVRGLAVRAPLSEFQAWEID